MTTVVEPKILIWNELLTLPLN